jgi:hypothetical protein
LWEEDVLVSFWDTFVGGSSCVWARATECGLTSRFYAAVSRLAIPWYDRCDAGSLFAHTGVFAGRHGL